MSSKAIIWTGGTIGALIGAYIPSLWHAGDFSVWGILFSTIGGVAGILIARNYA
jgi:hypothetical protein